MPSRNLAPSTGKRQAKNKPTPPKSELLALARKIDAERESWLRHLEAENRLDEQSIARMVELRRGLLQCEPANAVDALIMLSAARCLAAYMFQLAAADDEAGPETLHCFVHGILELYTGLVGVEQFLEKQSGVTLDALGIFQEGTSLQ